MYYIQVSLNNAASDLELNKITTATAVCDTKTSFKNLTVLSHSSICLNS